MFSHIPTINIILVLTGFPYQLSVLASKGLGRDYSPSPARDGPRTVTEDTAGSPYLLPATFLYYPLIEL